MSIFKGNGNPLVKEESFAKAAVDTQVDASLISEVMTVEGAVNKSFMLFGLMLMTSMISYMMPNMIFLWGGLIGGLVFAIWASRKQEKSPVLAPAYALCEGLFVGTVTAYYAAMYDGIVFQAISLTIAVLFMMLFIYKTGIIKVTKSFKAGVFMATGAIMLVYVVSIVLSFFGIQMPLLHNTGPIGIGISLVIIGVASLNLLIDFDMFEKGAEHGAPKYMEWYAGMALLITLVWLYIEILRLLSKLRD